MVGFVFLVFMIFLGGCASAPMPKTAELSGMPETIPSVEFDLQVLSGNKQLDGTLGDMGVMRLRLERNASFDPLTVSVEEDTPSGVGNTMRSSAWLAAVVAGMQSNDTMTGVRVNLRVPGTWTGPSAGGMICLAILSALEGRKLPADFAFTGAILPDGTIGPVGGLIEKLHAAKRNGISRVFIPSHLRFESDSRTKDPLDLRALATQLDLEVIPVENIDQTYRLIHGLSPSLLPEFNPSVMPVPDSFERYAKDRYQGMRRETTKILNALPTTVIGFIRSDPWFRAISIEPFFNAQKSLFSGKLLYAKEASEISSLGILAFAKARDFIEVAWRDAADVPAYRKTVDKELVSIFTALADSSTLARKCQAKLSPLGSQFCTQLHEPYSMISWLRQLEDETDERIAFFEAKPIEERPKNYDPTLEIRIVKWKQYAIASFAQLYFDSYIQNATDAFEALTDDRHISDRAAEIERLFFSAYLSAHNTLETEIIEHESRKRGVTTQAVWERIKKADYDFARYAPIPDLARKLHHALENPPPEPVGTDFMLALATQMYGDYLATASALKLRHGELGGRYDNEVGIYLYDNMSLLGHLIRSARSNALRSIQECERLGIPAVVAMSEFERAEFHREDREIDALDVLMGYWKARLRAKTLLMLFGSDDRS